MSKGEPPSTPGPADAPGSSKGNTLRLDFPAPAAPAADAVPADEEPEFDPHRFGKHEFPAGLREKLIATKLRTIPREELYDTVPPRGALQTPARGSQSADTRPDTPATKLGMDLGPEPDDTVEDGTPVAPHAPMPEEPSVIVTSDRDMPTEIRIRKLDLPLAAALDTSTISAIEDGNCHEWEVKRTQGGSIVDWKVAPEGDPLPERQAQWRRIALGVVAVVGVLALAALLTKLVSRPDAGPPAAAANKPEKPQAVSSPPAALPEPSEAPAAPEPHPNPTSVSGTETHSAAPASKQAEPKRAEPLRSSVSPTPTPAVPAPTPAASPRKGGILSKTLQEPPAE